MLTIDIVQCNSSWYRKSKRHNVII